MLAAHCEGMFDWLARKAGEWAASQAFATLAFGFVGGWVVGGFVRAGGFDDTYQLWLNSPTTALTFLLAVLLQRGANIFQKSVNARLDELIKVSTDARDDLLHLEDRTEKEIDALRP